MARMIAVRAVPRNRDRPYLQGLSPFADILQMTRGHLTGLPLPHSEAARAEPAARALLPARELVLLLTLAGIQFTNIVDFMILMPLAPQLMRLFEIDPRHFGFLVSAYTFAAAGSG